MDSNLLWQYIVVLAIILFAAWRVVAGIRKQNKAIKKGGSCCGCSLASSCKDYKKPPHRAQKSFTPDNPAPGQKPSENDCFR